jgi:hypothetical protein
VFCHIMAAPNATMAIGSNQTVFFIKGNRSVEFREPTTSKLKQTSF